MHTNDPITKSVSNAYIKMKAEELTAKQKKIDLNKNNKIDGEDLAKLRKEDNEVEEGWDDMMKAVKAKSGPQPSGGSGVKKGTRYGGSNQKDEPEVKEKPMTKTKKKPFSEMLETYKSAGLKSLFEAIEEKVFAEESTNDEFKAELDDTQSKSTGKKKAEVAKAKVDAVQQEEVETVEEDDTGYQDRYAVKNGKAVKHNPERGEKDEPHHVWADGPDHAVRKHAKMTKPGMKKEEVEELDEISTKTLAGAAKAASDPDSDYYYGKSHDPQKFADHAKKTKDAKSAAAVQGAADAKGHYPRDNHTSGYDKLAYRTPPRVTAAGKANKQDTKALKTKPGTVTIIDKVVALLE
jgi:hypothetical protein